MIVLSFLLVLAALGLLVVGLLGASQVLIWASIACSGAAGMCLVLAVLQQRRTGYPEPVDTLPETSGADAPTAVIAPAVGGAVPAKVSVPGAPGEPPPEGWSGPGTPPTVTGVTGEQPPAHRQADSDPGVPDQVDGPTYADPPDEPVEEQVAATDVLRTADLPYDVLVIDGRPRYHLVDCTHLHDREPVSLPLAEAREAGFTPCSLCRPDSTLAARTRERFGG